VVLELQKLGFRSLYFFFSSASGVSLDLAPLNLVRTFLFQISMANPWLQVHRQGMGKRIGEAGYSYIKSGDRAATGEGRWPMLGYARITRDPTQMSTEDFAI